MLFVVDEVAVAAPEHPLLVINLNARVDSAPFRALPSQVQGIQNNLSLANMDYAILPGQWMAMASSEASDEQRKRQRPARGPAELPRCALMA